VSETRFNDAPSLRVAILEIEPDFFEALKVPIVAGRGLEANDDSRTAVVISRRLALEMYGALNVVGHGFPKTKPEQTILGIAGDATLIAYQATNVAELYSPVVPERLDRLTLVVRARTNPEQLLGPMRDAARAADERVLAEARLMRTDFDGKVSGPRMASRLTGLTALLALLLACHGVFGVVSYGASLRTKEIGIRVALGARNGAIVRMLLRQLTWPALLGIVIGVAASLPVGRLFEGEPFYLNSRDTWVHAAAMLVLFAAGGAHHVIPGGMRRESNDSGAGLGFPMWRAQPSESRDQVYTAVVGDGRRDLACLGRRFQDAELILQPGDRRGGVVDNPL
jgi:hypothetical protein